MEPTEVSCLMAMRRIDGSLEPHAGPNCSTRDLRIARAENHNVNRAKRTQHWNAVTGGGACEEASARLLATGNSVASAQAKSRSFCVSRCSDVSTDATIVVARWYSHAGHSQGVQSFASPQHASSWVEMPHWQNALGTHASGAAIRTSKAAVKENAARNLLAELVILQIVSHTPG